MSIDLSSYVTTLRTSALLLVDCERLSTQWLTKLTKAANYRCDQLKVGVYIFYVSSL